MTDQPSIFDFVTDDAFRCSLVGPSRVGKTSLITAILDDAERAMAGLPASIIPADGPTRGRVQRTRANMDGAIAAGEFDSERLSQTTEPQIFNICLDADPGRSDARYNFSILDYPGEWLGSPETVGIAHQPVWEKCQQFMAESTVLLVPIDAAILMESVGPEQRRISHILGLPAVREVVVRWAKERNRAEHDGEPAVLLLCPLKCESYFNDNGGSFDKSELLYDQVQAHYGDIVDMARAEIAHGLQVLYAPIDTYGCVEFVKAEWIDGGDDTKSFRGHYRLRPPKKINPKGAASVVQIFCQLLVKGQRAFEEDELSAERSRARAHQRELNRDRGFFSRIYFSWSGQKANVEAAKSAAEGAAARLENRIDDLNDTLKELSDRELDSRATWMIP